MFKPVIRNSSQLSVIGNRQKTTAGLLLDLPQNNNYFANALNQYTNIEGATPSYDLDTAGAVVAHYEYDAFGNVTVATGTKKDDFTHRFSTKPIDAETGLYYYGYRYYDPVTGRWPSRDPIEENGGLNIYGMVGNAPPMGVDYLGLQAWMLCNRCEGTKGPMRCIVYDDKGGDSYRFTSNQDKNTRAAPSGEYDVKPKPDSQMDPPNRGLGNQNIENGRIGGPKGKPEFPVGTPSLTGPGMPAGKPKAGWKPVVRIYGRGRSDGCITTDRCGDIQRTMEDNIDVDDGGMKVEITEVCCEDGEGPSEPIPRAIPINE